MVIQNHESVKSQGQSPATYIQGTLDVTLGSQGLALRLAGQWTPQFVSCLCVVCHALFLCVSMFVFVYACMYACIHACMHACTQFILNIDVYVYTDTHNYSYLYVQIHMCMYLYIQICMYVSMYVCMDV